MAVLERLLPVLRETRVPIIVGYAYILAGWLAAAEFVDGDPDGASDAIRPLLEASEAFGPLGTGAALSLLAYFLGSTTGFLWEGPIPPWRRSVRLRFGRIRPELDWRSSRSDPRASFHSSITCEGWNDKTSHLWPLVSR
jgi:hypothetical protein